MWKIFGKKKSEPHWERLARIAKEALEAKKDTVTLYQVLEEVYNYGNLISSKWEKEIMTLRTQLAEKILQEKTSTLDNDKLVFIARISNDKICEKITHKLLQREPSFWNLSDILFYNFKNKSETTKKAILAKIEEKAADIDGYGVTKWLNRDDLKDFRQEFIDILLKPETPTKALMQIMSTDYNNPKWRPIIKEEIIKRGLAIKIEYDSATQKVNLFYQDSRGEKFEGYTSVMVDILSKILANNTICSAQEIFDQEVFDERGGREFVQYMILKS